MLPGKPTVEGVDLLADELAAEYSNVAYRAWYCRIIYQFGIDRVRYWQLRASSGDHPGKLFGYYVREAQSNKPEQPSHEDAGAVAKSGVDTVYQPTDEKMTPEGIDQLLTEALGRFNIQDPGAGHNAEQRHGEDV